MRKHWNHSTCVFALLVFVVASLLLMGAKSVTAQGETATVSGTASDPSGAALAGASVQARNVGTNVTQSTKTDAQGRYSIADLPVGEYEVQASMTGFQTVVHGGVTLTVGAPLVVDLTPPVGQMTQTVSVEAEVSRVETTTSSVSSMVSPTQMSNLPLNGRNYQQLFTLAPVVQTIPQTVAGGGTSATFYGGATNYSVSGSRPVGAAYLLDDQDLVSFWNHAAGSSVTGNSLGVDGIQEFQLLINTYSAQFGGSGGAMNAVSKSGTNTYHGSAYEFLRNSALDGLTSSTAPRNRSSAAISSAGRSAGRSRRTSSSSSRITRGCARLWGRRVQRSFRTSTPLDLALTARSRFPIRWGLCRAIR